MTEPVVANRPVIAFDVGILLRVAWLDVIQPDAFAFSPGDEGAADVFGTIIAANDLRFASPLDDLIQRPHNPL